MRVACAAWALRHHPAPMGPFLFKRFATPLGSSGMSALGEVRLSIPAADGDVLALLKPYVRISQ